MADVFGTDQPEILDAADGVTDFFDRIFGFGGADEIYGLGGFDRLYGGAGGDYLDGGDGLDASDYSESPLAVFASLVTGGVGGDANGDIYVNIENIDGSAFNDFLVGDGGDNRLFGAAGNDTLQGGLGRDYIYGEIGDDTITAGDGDDIQCFGGQGNDDISGGAGNDTQLRGDTGDDTISGGDGDDQVEGSEGADTLDGGAGIDEVSYGVSFVGMIVNLALGTASDGDTLTGIENVFGSGQNDTIVGDGNANKLLGNSSNDVLNGYSGNDILEGGFGDDILVGHAGADQLNGGDGIDRVSYSSSNAAVTVNLLLGTVAGGHADGDTLIEIEGTAGSAFADVLTGNDTGANRLGGNAGNDTLSGLGGDDMLEGGDGNDVLLGGLGADILNGGAGGDRADYTASNASVTVNLTAGDGAGGHAHGDRFTAIEYVTGSNHADALFGNTLANQLAGQNGDDLLTGGGGNDVLTGGAGADEIYGGTGIDRADYTGSTSGVQVSLAAGTAAGGHALGDLLAGIEYLSGSSFNDTLTGDGGANVLTGGDGNDTLRGGDGNDRQTGGLGNDVHQGGAGLDAFVFTDDTQGNDRIDDWVAASDQLEVDASAFGGGLAAGALLANRLVVGAFPVANQAFGQFLYNTTSGQLSWDVDGTGATAAIAITRLLNGGATIGTLAVGDFDIVA